MKTHFHIAALLYLLAALVSACKTADPVAAKSTEKSITAFSFASPALAATINGTRHHRYVAGGHVGQQPRPHHHALG